MEVTKELKKVFAELNEKPIAYQRVYAKLTGNITSGLVLSQLMYWAQTMNYDEFYKTDKDISDEIYASIKEIRGAKAKLIRLGLIEVTIKGVPAKTYYKISLDNIINKIISLPPNRQIVGQTRMYKRDKLECTKGTNWNRQKGQTRMYKRDKLYTENNTENNTENYLSIKQRQIKQENSPTCQDQQPPLTEQDKSCVNSTNEIINLFKTVNPSYQRLFANKTERGAVDRLIANHGIEAITSIVEKLPDIIFQPYAPKITTPYQLERDLGKLIIFIEQQQEIQQSRKGGLAILI
jgi:hypothetical protein